MKRLLLCLFIGTTLPIFSQQEKLDSLLNVLETETDDSVRARLLSDVSSIYFYYGEYEKALHNCITSMELVERFGNKRMLGRRQGNLASLHLYMGDNRKALEYSFKAIETSALAKDSFHIANVLGNVGAIYGKMHMADSALMFFALARNRWAELDQPLRVAQVLVNEGTTLFEVGRKEEAWEVYQHGIEILKPVSTDTTHLDMQILIKTVRPELYSLAANTLTSLERYDEALAYFNMLERQPDLSQTARQSLYYGLARVHEILSNYKAALEYYTKYRKVTDSLVTERSKQEMKELSVKYETESTKRENLRLKVQSDLQKRLLEERRIFLIMMCCITFLIAIIAILLLTMLSNKSKVNERLNDLNRDLVIARERMEIKALLAQMNPHFIFNALQSIQEFIVKGDKESSNRYLATFGSLIRANLESSDKEFLPLHAELKMVQSYVELESLRLDKPLEFDVHLSDGLDEYNTLVPPMLIQPFVENGIWHGIIPSSEEVGKIQLHIDQVEDHLHYTLYDNGIGYNGPRGIQLTEGANDIHGMDITKARLAALWVKEERDAAFQIITNPGTKVSFNVPITF